MANVESLCAISCIIIYHAVVECMSLALWHYFLYILHLLDNDIAKAAKEPFLPLCLYGVHRTVVVGLCYIYRPVYPYSQNLIIPDNNNLVLLIWLLTIYVFKVYSLSYYQLERLYFRGRSGIISNNAFRKEWVINLSIYILSQSRGSNVS